MAGVFGLIAKGIAEKLRVAQAAEAAVAAERELAQQRAIAQAMAREHGPAQPVGVPGRRTAPAVPSRATPPAARPVRAAVPLWPSIEDSFPTHADSVMAMGGPRPESPLLAAFGGGAGLLAGLVLSVALAPPVALRAHEPPH